MNEDANYSMTTQWIQLWTVPRTWVYEIEVAWARWTKTSDVHFWAKIIWDLYLIKWTKLKILVWQMWLSQDSGWWGTFISDEDNNPLLVAWWGCWYNWELCRGQLTLLWWAPYPYFSWQEAIAWQWGVLSNWWANNAWQAWAWFYWDWVDNWNCWAPGCENIDQETWAAPKAFVNWGNWWYYHVTGGSWWERFYVGWFWWWWTAKLSSCWGGSGGWYSWWSTWRNCHLWLWWGWWWSYIHSSIQNLATSNWTWEWLNAFNWQSITNLNTYRWWHWYVKIIYLGN